MKKVVLTSLVIGSIALASNVYAIGGTFGGSQAQMQNPQMSSMANAPGQVAVDITYDVKGPDGRVVGASIRKHIVLGMNKTKQLNIKNDLAAQGYAAQASAAQPMMIVVKEVMANGQDIKACMIGAAMGAAPRMAIQVRNNMLGVKLAMENGMVCYKTVANAAARNHASNSDASTRS